VLLRAPPFWTLVNAVKTPTGASSSKEVSLCSALGAFGSKMLSSSTITCEQATDRLRKHIYKNFSKSQQHDAHEFFTWVHNELRTAVAGQAALNQRLNALFDVQTRERHKCSVCHEVSETPL
jgi:uncharacterized UBP type Zn finger protein